MDIIEYLIYPKFWADIRANSIDQDQKSQLKYVW